MIGAGSAGLTAIRELRLRGIDVVCYEQGTQIGGNWRYENDNGVSAAYASLRCNVSRRRMEYRAFAMPASYGQFVSHSDMAAYLDAYAAAFGLRQHIRFASRVTRIEPLDGGWRVGLEGGSEQRHSAVIVANGHDWQPAWPSLPGRESATIPLVHAHDYRTPDPYRGQRTLVVGTGQSACEIATELAREVGHATISARSGAHVIPRRMYGLAFDELDQPHLNRLPWWFINRFFDVGVRLARTPTDGVPRPPWRILEQVPIVSSDICRAIAAGQIAVAGPVAGIDGDRVRFADGTSACFDRVICATGYRLSFPFIDDGVLTYGDKEIELYRRIVPPATRGLFLIGFVDAPSGNLKIFEHQAAWIADVLEGRVRLPPAATMRELAAHKERRTRERFPREAAHSIRTDAHAHVRNLRRDRRRGRAAAQGLPRALRVSPRYGAAVARTDMDAAPSRNGSLASLVALLGSAARR